MEVQEGGSNYPKEESLALLDWVAVKKLQLSYPNMDM